MEKRDFLLDNSRKKGLRHKLFFGTAFVTEETCVNPVPSLSIVFVVFQHSVLIQGSVVVIRQFLIFINQTFLMVSVALVTMVD